MASVRTFTGKGLVSIIISAAAVLDLLFLYFVKYQNQNLPLSNFNLTNTGNFLNLIFTILLLLGAGLYYWKKEKYIHPTLLIFLAALMTFFLVAAAINSLAGIPLPDIYIYQQPLDNLLTGILFSAFQVTQFIIISVLWLSFLDKDKYLLLRGAVNSVIVITLLMLYAFYFINQPVSRNSSIYNNKEKNNVAVVLGAAVWSYDRPSPSLAARIDKAAELYDTGIINKIQLTGSNAPGELTEAEVAFKHLQNKNINNYDIWIEEKTTSTSEQVHYIKENLMMKENIDNVLIISDSYHLKRIKEICKFYNVNAEVVASGLKFRFNNKLYYKLRESVAMLVFWFFAI